VWSEERRAIDTREGLRVRGGLPLVREALAHELRNAPHSTSPMWEVAGLAGVPHTPSRVPHPWSAPRCRNAALLSLTEPAEARNAPRC
jgi:hypothetical protein